MAALPEPLDSIGASFAELPQLSVTTLAHFSATLADNKALQLGAGHTWAAHDGLMQEEMS